MKSILGILAVSVLAVTATGGIVSAKEHRDDHDDNHQYVRHDEWKKGARMNHDDCNRGKRSITGGTISMLRHAVTNGAR
jgi:hypothetical protein